MTRRVALRVLYYLSVVMLALTCWWIAELANRGAGG